MSQKKSKGRKKAGSKKPAPGVEDIDEALRINAVTLRRWKNLASAHFCAKETERKERQIASLQLEIAQIKLHHVEAPQRVANIEVKQKELRARKVRAQNTKTIERLQAVAAQLRAAAERLRQKGQVGLAGVMGARVKELEKEAASADVSPVSGL